MLVFKGYRNLKLLFSSHAFITASPRAIAPFPPFAQCSDTTASLAPAFFDIDINLKTGKIEGLF